MPVALMFIPPSPAAYDAALEGLTAENEWLMRSGPLPPLYASGVRYETEKQEMFRHAAMVAASGVGDCEDLAAYRAAELRVTGEDPDACVHTYVSGPRRLHAVVRRGDGSIEDPSLVLGMQPGRSDVSVSPDPLGGMDALTYDRDVSGGFRFRVPLQPAPGRPMAMWVRTPPRFARDVSGLWGQALRITRAVLSTPEAQALLPPGALLAIQRAKTASALSQRIARASRAPGPSAPPALTPDQYIPPPPQPDDGAEAEEPS